MELFPLAQPEAALEKYLLLAKNVHGAGVGKFITEAVFDADTFVFGELLDLPGVRDSACAELELLRLFAFGTYRDYVGNRAKYGDVPAAALRKLKMLTVVTLGAQSPVLPYDALRAALDLGTVRELEDLLIDGVYRGIFRGRLDQHRARFELHDSIGRDLQPTQLDAMIADLGAWSQKSTVVLQQLEEQAGAAQRAFEDMRAANKTLAEEVAASKEKLARSAAAGAYAAGAFDSSMGAPDSDHAKPRRNRAAKR